MTSLVGTGALVRLALRLDRFRLPIWIIAIAGITAASASTLGELYPTVESRQQFGASLGRNPALVALTGPFFDLSTVGGLTSWRMASFGGVLVGVMSVLTVIRHTRTEEESGRLELIGSAVVGRYAALTSSLVVAAGTSLVLGLVTALGLVGLGEPAAGSFALGLGFTASGMVFGAIAALAAQLTTGARTALGISAASIGVAFLLRAAGDAAGDSGAWWLSWLSPIGWVQQLRPFSQERWWVLGLAAAVAVALGAVAYALVARRDLDSGLLPTRLGPAQAGAGLGGPFGLAWRLHRGLLFGWTVGFAVIGAVFALASDGINDLVEQNPQLKAIITTMGGAQSVVDAYFSGIVGILGLVAAVYTVQATLRLRTEETGQRAEPILATRVGRVRWALSHLVFAFLGTVVMLAAAGASIGLVYGLRSGNLSEHLPSLLGAALAQAPAALVLAGVSALLFGLVPRLVMLSWAVLVGCLLLGQLGPFLQLADWVMDLSPFTHIPKLPAADPHLAPLLWLTAIALAMAAAGLTAFRRRDLG